MLLTYKYFSKAFVFHIHMTVGISWHNGVLCPVQGLMKYINDIGTQSKVRNCLLSETGLFKLPVVWIFLICTVEITNVILISKKFLLTVGIKLSFLIYKFHYLCLTLDQLSLICICIWEIYKSNVYNQFWVQNKFVIFVSVL